MLGGRRGLGISYTTVKYFSESPMAGTNQRLVSSCIEELSPYTLSRHLIQHAVAMDIWPIHYIHSR